MNQRPSAHGAAATSLPLDGVLVLDLSQFMAGPAAALRLADLGARVIKVERPGHGEAGRSLSFGGLELDGDTVEFHTINRNKESFEADLKDPASLAEVWQLIERADVLIQNFRPSVIHRLGLGYEAVAERNPRLVYGSVSGYGANGPWANKPGQDLLAQAVSGLPWLNGSRTDTPIAVGLAIADLLASTHLTQGILACLARRYETGRGGLVEVSLLESLLDLQFEVLTAYLTDPDKAPRRGPTHSAHSFLSAPYGIYPTADGFLAVAMNPVPKLGRLLGIPALEAYDDPDSWFSEQDEITALLAEHLAKENTETWLKILEPADVWCAELFDLPSLIEHDAFAALDMVQTTVRDDGVAVQTTRCPIRIDGQVLKNARGAPRLGADTENIRRTL